MYVNVREIDMVYYVRAYVGASCARGKELRFHATCINFMQIHVHLNAVSLWCKDTAFKCT